MNKIDVFLLKYTKGLGGELAIKQNLLELIKQEFDWEIKLDDLFIKNDKIFIKLASKQKIIYLLNKTKINDLFNKNLNKNFKLQ